MTTHFAQLVEDGAAVEMRAFSEAEIAIVLDALRIANAHYRSMEELMRMPSCLEFRAQFAQQARDAGDLQLKIEAAR